MKAVLYDGPNQMSLVDLPEPAAAAAEVKLRVGACGICGSDVHGYTGESGRRTAGQVMGHEFSGTIAAVGSGVKDWRVGQRVAAFNIIGCGDCPHCATANVQRCPKRKVIGVNTGKVGAFAEYVCVPAANLAPLADHISFSTALLNEPLAVSYHALGHVPKETKTLAIVGGGTIGQCLARVAKLVGDFDVCVLEPLESKRELLANAGFRAIPSDLESLRHIWPGGADCAVEAVGGESTVRFAIDVVRPAGAVILLGNLAKEVRIPLQDVISAEKKLLGTYGFNLADFKRIVAAINEGAFELDPLLSGSCTLEETPQVFADLASGRRQAVKIVVEP